MSDHKGFTLWMTGLSGSGKSTITEVLIDEFEDRDIPLEVLDGDVVRENLSKGLGFSKEDRDINISRIAFVADLLSRNGVPVITAAISPYRETRDHARQIHEGNSTFVEVFVATSLEDCEARDTKGLYAKARSGEIKEFTGISDPYEEPLDPELRIETAGKTPEESAQDVLDYLEAEGLISAK
ncbi:MAG: adenylyl-sulfate kinase [Solirubrobacterales bacterium]|nr:adenylyl-sulfate kinase [Solirubrobacterales bacterium]MCB8971252.1 adenylyl-sulfate kinase [Thermoleophilales bacterium]MCO5325893.1 adenylyl-sulfate kinase [Solirubrobacterales bacterium]